MRTYVLVDYGLLFSDVNITCSASHFARGIVMPNLKPPITTTAAAVSYRESILKALPAGSDFTPLMTLYLTDTTNPNEIKLASKPPTLFDVQLAFGVFKLNRASTLVNPFKASKIFVLSFFLFFHN